MKEIKQKKLGIVSLLLVGSLMLPNIQVLTANAASAVEYIWYTDDILLTLEGSTDTGGSGLKGYQYNINDNGWIDYTSETEIKDSDLEDFKGEIYYRSVDNATNPSEEGRIYIGIDKVPPAKPVVTYNPTTEFSNEPVNILIDVAVDMESRLNTYEISEDDGTTWKLFADIRYSTSEIDIFSDKTMTALIRATDVAGNVSPPALVAVKIDTVNPTAPDITKDSIGEFSNTDTHVTVSGGTDDFAGIDHYEYSTDNLTWVTYTTPISFSSSKTVYARSVDKATNKSEVVKTDIKIDKQNPSAPTFIKNPAEEFSSTDIIYTVVDGIDVGESGTDKTYALVDGIRTELTSNTLTVTQNAEVKFITVDRAGNTSIEVIDTAKIDRTPSNAPVFVKTPDIDFTDTSMVISIEGSTDAESGIDRYEYKLNAGPWQTYSAPIAFTEHNYISARAFNNAGLVSDVAAMHINIDITDPIGTSKHDIKWTNTDVPILVRAYDVESGIKEVKSNAVGSTEIFTFDPLQIRTIDLEFIATENGDYSYTITNGIGYTTIINHVVENIDKTLPTPPKTEESLETTPPTEPDKVETNWTNEPLEIVLSTEAPSGIKSLSYRVDNLTPQARRARSIRSAIWTEYNGNKFKFVDEGVFKLYVRSTSNAGNVSEVSEYLVRNDYTAPQISIVEPEGEAPHIEVFDRLSGVATHGCKDHSTCGLEKTLEHNYQAIDGAGNTGVLNIPVIQRPTPPSGGGGNNDDDFEFDFKWPVKEVPVIDPVLPPLPVVPETKPSEKLPNPEVKPVEKPEENPTDKPDDKPVVKPIEPDDKPTGTTDTEKKDSFFDKLIDGVLNLFDRLFGGPIDFLRNLFTSMGMNEGLAIFLARAIVALGVVALIGVIGYSLWWLLLFLLARRKKEEEKPKEDIDKED